MDFDGAERGEESKNMFFDSLFLNLMVVTLERGNYTEVGIAKTTWHCVRFEAVEK